MFAFSLGLMVSVFAPAPVAAPGGSAIAQVCTRVASPSGRDDGRGTLRDPYRSVQWLVQHLRPGQTGCLLGGLYDENIAIERGGARGRPLTLRSAPGDHATLRGRLWISDTANDVVISFLRLDGSTTGGAPSPQVNGDRVAFRFTDVTNDHTAICFILGGDFNSYGRAVGTTIHGNRIHDCGRLPATNHDHGIYIEGARSTRVTNNVISGNADWGVHLYPDADDSYVANNVIFGNGGGVIIAGEAAGGEYSRSYASDTNVIERNVIANSLRSHNVETYWGGVTGQGNLVRKNCLWNANRGNFGDLTGLSVRDNLVANPHFMNPARGNFDLQSRSRCLRLGAGLSP